MNCVTWTWIDQVQLVANWVLIIFAIVAAIGWKRAAKRLNEIYGKYSNQNE